jgi:DHA1 family inner membrane transport protein
MPLALYALTAGAFGIGVTEFVIMGLLLEVGADFGVSIQAAGLLISGYALGVVVGAPLLTALTERLPRKTVLLGLMVIFTLGNAACALRLEQRQRHVTVGRPLHAPGCHAPG